MDIFNSNTGQWSSTTMPDAQMGEAAATVGDYAIFAGGSDASSYTDAVNIFDPYTSIWSSDTLSVGRRYLGATSLGSSVYFAGGDINVAADSNAVDIYSLPAPIPEPTTGSLLLIAGVGLFMRRGRRRLLATREGSQIILESSIRVPVVCNAFLCMPKPVS